MTQLYVIMYRRIPPRQPKVHQLLVRETNSQLHLTLANSRINLTLAKVDPTVKCPTLMLKLIMDG